MTKVSVIIPVYRVESQIADCIRSVCSQSRPPYEIILVDDATDDGSMAAADRVLAEFPAQRVLRQVHPENRGISAARNTGMDAATGDYFLFVDSDDELAPDCLERLTAPLSQKAWDMVIGDYTVSGKDLGFPPLEGAEGPVEGNPAIRLDYLRGRWYVMVWNKLLRAEYVRSAGLRFAEGLPYEDNIMSLDIALTAGSMYIVKGPTYIYKIREGSLITGRKRQAMMEKWPAVLERCRRSIRERNAETDRTANSLLQWYFRLGVAEAAPLGREAILQQYHRLRAVFPDGRMRFLLASHGHWGGIRRDLHWILPARIAGIRFERRYFRHGRH